MIEIIYVILFVTVLYIVPLVYFMKKAYEDVEGMFILIGILPVVNFIFMFISLVVEGSEAIINKIKSRNKP